MLRSLVGSEMCIRDSSQTSTPTSLVMINRLRESAPSRYWESNSINTSHGKSTSTPSRKAPSIKSLNLFKRAANLLLRKSLVESLVLSKINVLLSDLPKSEIKRLQKVQNAAAGYVLRRHANINDVLSLKWLPVAESIESSLANTCLLYTSPSPRDS